MDELHRIQQAIRKQKYRISIHANEELADDLLEAADIEHIILTGNIAHRFTDDPRGTRYEVLGETSDYRRVYVVCRFTLSGILLIITTYAE
jgi:hypothetical protein